MENQILILTWIQTVAGVIGLAGVLVAVYTLLQNLNQRDMTSIGQISFNERSMGYFTVKNPGVPGLLFGKKPELRLLPTIGCLIRAGDNTMYTSAMFDQGPPSSTTVCWVNLYIQFFNQIALRHEPYLNKPQQQNDIPLEGIECVEDILSRASSNVWEMKEKLKKVEEFQIVEARESPRIKRLSSVTLGSRSSISRSQSSDEENVLPGEELSEDFRLEKKCLYARVQRESLYQRRKMVNCVLDLDHDDKSSAFMLWATTTQAPRFTSTDNFQRPMILDQKPCIEISREELAGLALTLGIRLTAHDRHTLDGQGPFGISLSGHRTDIHWRIHISHQHRQADRATKGSGYSILFAKHLACGSVPFKKSQNLVHCICVNRPVLDMILKGEHIDIHKRDRHPTSLNYLIHLPATSQLCIYGASHRTIDNLEDEELPLGSIFDTTSHHAVTTWPRVVARIVFGGLVPQANSTLVDAVQFTVSTRINPCGPECEPADPCVNLVNALTQLRSIINNKALELNIFEDLDRHGVLDDSTVGETNCLVVSNNCHTGALFARYMTLLERLVALSGCSVEEVYEACCKILELAYNVAVEKESAARKKREAEMQIGCVENYTLEDDEDEEQLSMDIENVESKIKEGEELTVEDCANVARCILAAWAWRVRKIRDLEWRQGDSEFVPPSDGRPEPDDSPAMADLPSVSALGIL